MKSDWYEVILTNGTINHAYKQHTIGEQQAIILSQAEAIQNARGYELISVKKL